MADPRVPPGLIEKCAKTPNLKPYENTVLGLLRKRRDLLGDTDKLRKALSANMEDIRALDRTLRSLGYKGDLKRMTPAGTRQVVFHRDELRRFLLAAGNRVGWRSANRMFMVCSGRLFGRRTCGRGVRELLRFQAAA